MPNKQYTKTFKSLFYFLFVPWLILNFDLRKSHYPLPFLISPPIRKAFKINKLTCCLKGARSWLTQENWERTTWKKTESLFSNFPLLQSSRTQSVQSWVILASNLSDLLALWSTITKLQTDGVIFTDRWTFWF